MNLVPDREEFDAAAPLPAGLARRGTPQQLMLFSRMLSLPIWDMAVQTEGRTGIGAAA
ncbi:MAG TPA: hypothetical protein VGQ34_12050 [Sphingomicrobium sp.]|jgi:hypothetical protein|nr:hypothetical protein [Sphingomicrobium sp.]